jgi:capsular exopolysaccharide synthesis family protein
MPRARRRGRHRSGERDVVSPGFLVEPDSASAEPLRALRLAVEARLGSKETRGLVFTSPSPGDGRSTIAANYALVAAYVQRPVLLIDADMRKPNLHTMFDVPLSPGLVDVLRDRLDPWEATHRFPALGGLHVLTAGSSLPRPGDVAASPAMGDLLETAYADCESVVLDSPPVLVAADASGLASHSRTAVLMIMNRSGKRRHLASALRKLTVTEANIVGLVLNREGPLAPEF